MKYDELKKRLFLESGVIAAIIAVVGIGLFLLDNFADDYEKDRQALESKVSELSTTTNATRAKYDKIKQNRALYDKIVLLESQDGLMISQQALKNHFNQFRDQYYLNSLHLNMSPLTEMTGPNYRRNRYVIVSSPASFTFDGLSDEYAYSLINALEQDLPGGGKLTSVTLTRQGAVTEDALHAISENGAFPLIKADIQFTWFGIKTLEPTDSSANAPKNKP